MKRIRRHLDRGRKNIAPSMSYRMWLVLLVTIIVIVFGSVMQLSITGYFVAKPITIDGNFSEWDTVLSDPDNVMYDGPWGNLTDLDNPQKPSRDLTEFASTWDNDYIYFYFERADSHAHVGFFVYIDKDNDGLMEDGEPVVYFNWPKDKGDYTTDIYHYRPYNISGDSMNCGDGCTMPGTEDIVWRDVEKLEGSSGDYTRLETRIRWDWLDISIDSGGSFSAITSAVAAQQPSGEAGPGVRGELSSSDQSPDSGSEGSESSEDSSGGTGDKKIEELEEKQIIEEPIVVEEPTTETVEEPIVNETIEEQLINETVERVVVGSFEPANLQFHVSSFSGNIIDNLGRYFLLIDEISPSITNVQPTAGSKFADNSTVPISATVIDDVAVDTVIANITLPDSTAEQLTLTSNNSVYTADFTNTSLLGNYSVIIIANDTNGNTDTNTTWFKILPGINFIENVTDSQGNPVNVTIIIVDPETGQVIYNSTEDYHNTTIPIGLYDVWIIEFPETSPIENVTFHDVNFSSPVNQLIDLEETGLGIIFLDPDIWYKDVFALNLVLQLNYSYATFVAIADDEELYKCRVYDFEDQICYGQWVKILNNLVPGELYSINLTPGDPAFGEGSSKLTLTTITVDGNITDWDAVLDNPNNIVTDGISGVNDNDTVQTAARDITKFAFTWDEDNFYTYYRRVYGTPSAISYIVYLDYGLDGYMNATDKVLRFTYRGGSQKYDAYIYDYVPSGGTPDILTGDGVDMPGSITNETTLETNVIGGAPNAIEMESNISWTNLGVPAGTPFKFHISLAKGDTTNIPADVEDNMGAGSTLLADVLIYPDNSYGAQAGYSVLYNHTVKNLGNDNDTFDINLTSNKGFTTQALWTNGTPLTDTDGDSIVDIGLLGPDQSKNITINITVPAGTATGTKDITKVTATSSFATGISSTAYDTTFVGSITIIPSYFGRMANGTVFTYNHTVTNNLGSNTVINLNATSNQGWSTQLLWPNGSALTDTDFIGGVDVGNVSAGGSADFLLQLTIPVTATDATLDKTTITANSSVTPSDSGFVLDRTTVAPRVEVEPDQTGEAGIGTSIFYEHEVVNNWNNSDVIDINYSSILGWPVALFEADKTTPLNDTDSDSTPDTGTLSYAGGSTKIVAKVTVPTTTQEGDMDSTTITGTSSNPFSDSAVDNTTAEILVLYNNSARTQKDYNYVINETVYAKAFGLVGINDVYFVWIDGNATVQRTSPDITVDANNQAIDELTTNDSHAPGNWTVVLHRSNNNQEITRRNFNVSIPLDTTPPSVENIQPTPGTIYNQSDTVTVSANVTDTTGVDTVLASITLPNATIEQITLTDPDNNTIYDDNFTNTNLTGRYNITIIANDTYNNINDTESTWFNVTVPIVDITPPTIISTTIDPYDPVIGYNVSLNASATDNIAIDGVFANITLPNTTTITVTLPIDYTVQLLGRHNVTFFANDTAGNLATVEDYFIAGTVPINVTFNVVDNNFTGIPVNLTIYFTGTDKEINLYSFIGTTIDAHTNIFYDLYYKALGSNITVRLNEVNLSLDINDTLGLDRFIAAPGFLVTYGLYSTYNFTEAEVTASYAGTGYTDEDYLGLYVCSDWNFTAQTCPSNWTQFVGAQNKAQDTFTFIVTSFSAFSIKQEAVPTPPAPPGPPGVVGITAVPRACNNNTICEADIGETYLTCLADCPLPPELKPRPPKELPIYYIGNFDINDTFTVEQMQPNQLWIFTYKDVNYTTQIIEIIDGFVKFKIAEDIFITLNVGQTTQIDTDKDAFKDITFILNDVKGPRINVTLTLLKPLEIVPFAPQWQLALALALVLFFIVFLFSRRRKEKKKIKVKKIKIPRRRRIKYISPITFSALCYYVTNFVKSSTQNYLKPAYKKTL